jgi:integrase
MKKARSPRPIEVLRPQARRRDRPPPSHWPRTDLKVIQQMLGHSSIVTTADTYTSVLPETAQATADMVIKAARCTSRFHISRGRRFGARATDREVPLRP